MAALVCSGATGDTKSAPFRPLASPANPGSVGARLAMTPSGRVLMSWLEPRPGNGHALRMAWLDQGRWSAPSTIAEGDSFFVNWADAPGVHAADDRRLVATWPWGVGGGGEATHLRVARSADGGHRWSAPATLHRDATGTEHGFASLVSTKDDGIVAVWLDGHNFVGHAEGEVPGPDMTLHGVRLHDSGRDAEHEVDARVCDCCQTAAVATARGVIVAYRDRSRDEVRDISLARFEAGHWSAPFPLHADGWHIAGCPVNGPALAARGEDVAAAWFTGARDTSRVSVAFSADDGIHFGPPIHVDLGQPVGHAAIAILPDRTALVAWLENTGGDAALQMRRVSPAGTMSRAWTISGPEPARSRSVPQLVASKQSIIVAWTAAGKPGQVRLAMASTESFAAARGMRRRR